MPLIFGAAGENFEILQRNFEILQRNFEILQKKFWKFLQIIMPKKKSDVYLF